MAFLKGFAVMVFLAAAMVSGGSAQQVPDCASKLISCANYLNSTTTPPPACCDPLKDAVKNELSCLCDLFRNEELFKQFQINMTQAMQLPQHCGVPGGVNACNSGSAPAPTAGSPPGTPGGENDAGKLAWTGGSTLIGVLLLWASMVVNV